MNSQYVSRNWTELSFLSPVFTICFAVCRKAGECPSGAAPPFVQSCLALLQIQPDQLQDRPVTLHHHLWRKLDPRRATLQVEELVSPLMNVTSS